MAAPKLELFRDIALNHTPEIRGVTVETVRVHRPTLGQFRAACEDNSAAWQFVKDQTGRELMPSDLDEMIFEDADAIDEAIQDFLPPRLRRQADEVLSSLSQPSSPQNSPASETPSPSTSEQQ